MSVRLSTNDWFEGGNTPEDALIFASMFKAAGADIIDCSSGQVVKEEKPIYGRLYQTPFADKIRNEIHIPTVAVGAISEADQANSIIAAGRADLCAVARPHLADPAWVLHEAAQDRREIGRLAEAILCGPRPIRDGHRTRRGGAPAASNERRGGGLAAARGPPCAGHRRGLGHRRGDRRGGSPPRARA